MVSFSFNILLTYLCFPRAQVLRVVPQNDAQMHYLAGLLKLDLYDFWTEPKAVGKYKHTRTNTFTHINIHKHKCFQINT